MVQGVTTMPTYNGPFDVIRKVLKVEGFFGLYRGFGITVLTQSPASALWWGSYATAQRLIWRLFVVFIYLFDFSGFYIFFCLRI